MAKGSTPAGAAVLLAAVLLLHPASFPDLSWILGTGGREAFGERSRSEEPDASAAFYTPRSDLAAGVALGLFYKEPGYDYSVPIRDLAGTGARWISLIYSLYQEDATATTVVSDPYLSPGPDALRRAIRASRENGLRVMVFPILLLRQKSPCTWRGVIEPSDRDAWFASYAENLSELASIAASEGAEIFSIGSELLSLEDEADRWAVVARSVRERFPGKILYSANWDHYRHVSFWSEVDYLALNAYYGLSDRPDPVFETLASSWNFLRIEITEYASSIGKPIVFTEIGYPSIDGGSVAPWDYTREAKPDAREQLLCYAAFVQAWRREPSLHGVFFYDWWGCGGSGDGGYTPRGKPALRILRDWCSVLSG